jgi:hypothetical protein
MVFWLSFNRFEASKFTKLKYLLLLILIFSLKNYSEAQCYCANTSGCVSGNCGNLSWVTASNCISPVFSPPGASTACNNWYGTWLPINLVSFDLSNSVDASIFLTWTTASELNNDFFEIQKSIDGENFVKHTQVNGSGNSSSLKSYQTLDSFPAVGFNYYRIRQVDFDGRETYYEPKGIFFHPNDQNTIVYPNPVYDNVLYISSIHTVQSIEIIDIHWKVVYTSTETSVIHLNNLNSGVYFIKVNLRNRPSSIHKLLKY